MECPHCHAMLADGARFCPYCGNALDAAPAVEQTVAAPAVGSAPQSENGAPSVAPGVDNSNTPVHKKSHKKVAGIVVACVAAVAVACGGGAAYYMHQQQVKEQAAYELAHSKHTIIVKVSADGWDTSAGSSRVPVHVKGKDADGKKVNKVFYVDSKGRGISLIQGKYKIKAAASPIAADGTVYKTPCTSAELTLDSVFSKGEKIDLADLADKDAIFSFSPIDAVDVTDDDISSAYVYATQDKGKGAADADALSQAATKRRDDAVAAKKAADEEAARQAEEQRKAAARHIEAETFSVDLPEYWDGRVTTEVDGDTITVRSKLYPSREVVTLVGSEHPDPNMGDYASGGLKIVHLKDDFSVRINCTRWGAIAGDELHREKYGNSPVTRTVSDEEATELTDLQSIGTTSFELMRKSFTTSAAGFSDAELTQLREALVNALEPNIKLL